MDKKTILLPTDFSDSARNAIEYALKLYAGRGYHYVLLNTVETNTASSAGMMVNMSEILIKDSHEGLKKDQEWMQTLKEFDGCTLETFQVFGNLVDCIRQILKERKIDAVVLGTTGASGLKEFFVGSNASSVIQESPIPVLTVPFNAVFKPIHSIVYASDLNGLKNNETLSFLKNLLLNRSAHLIVLNVIKSSSKVAEVQKEEELERLKTYFSPGTFELATIENDDTVDGINEYTKKHRDVDIITMVPRRKNFFEKIFTKSVSKKVAYHSQVPMLTLQDA